MIMYGLCGAHRTGKTTLAKQLGLLGFKYIDVDLSGVQKGHGYDSSNQTYDWETRKNIQELLLNHFVQLIVDMDAHGIVSHAAIRAEPMVILDRTPLDLIGYTLLNYPEFPTPEDNEWFTDFANRCHHLTQKYFSAVMLVQPGIPIEGDPKSAPAIKEMIEELNQYYLAEFMKPSSIRTVIMPAEITGLHERIQYTRENMLCQIPIISSSTQ